MTVPLICSAAATEAFVEHAEFAIIMSLGHSTNTNWADASSTGRVWHNIAASLPGRSWDLFGPNKPPFRRPGSGVHGIGFNMF